MSASRVNKDRDYGDSDFTADERAESRTDPSTETPSTILFQKEQKTIIERNFIPVGKLNEDDVKYEVILELRRDAMGFFRDQVNTIMVRKINMLGIRNRNLEKVRNMKDLNQFVSNKKNLSVHSMEILFYIFYGTFDQNKGNCLYLFMIISNYSQVGQEIWNRNS